MDWDVVAVTVRWRTDQGEPVPGQVVLQRRVSGAGDEPWRALRVLHTDAAGLARATVRPRVDVRYRAVTRPLDWVRPATSPAVVLRNLPPAPPVRLPAAAPSPRRTLPAQPRPDQPGARIRIGRIPDGVWGQMTGRTWHAGCPVGREGLRLLRITYWGYDGYAHRGELVAANGAVRAMAGALAAMYRARLPLRSLYRVDRFGHSGRVRGGNDYASMAAGNSSAFNCRDVVGRPGVRSPHAYGRALDLNTWENPFRSMRGLVPNAWWQGHSDPRVAWRSGEHRVVRLMRAHGLSWTYGLSDTQHFDVRRGSARPVARACVEEVCD